MARRRIAAGELGDIQVTFLANGTGRARVRARDDAEELHQQRVVAVIANKVQGAGGRL
ncbi:hypothetical protein [Leifsonia poae]|uniref:hypothetical protein n=1 Tax=Leifsonia poae TaxID=110933 RepID=UPI001CBA8FAB|nr:hypothetical protein [Leifsonia poae]